MLTPPLNNAALSAQFGPEPPSPGTLRGVRALLRSFAAGGLMEAFLLRWTEYMRSAGYLQFTTAKRADCEASCLALLDPLLRRLEKGPPAFQELAANAGGWADALLHSGLRHIRRGITEAMFQGCFITFVRALEDSLPEPALPEEAEATQCAKALLRLYGDAFTVLWAAACAEERANGASPDKDEVSRMLTLEKCRFENVLNTTSDGMAVINEEGVVTTVNSALCGLAGRDVTGMPLWEALHLEGNCAADFFRYYPVGQTAEVTPFNSGSVHLLSISPLGQVSLASGDEYLVMLCNITPQAMQREVLEEAVRRHTADLVNEKARLEEMNITLRNVLRNVAEERERGTREPAESVYAFLPGALARLAEETNADRRKSLADAAAEKLQSVLSATGEAGQSPDRALHKLTLAEYKVCRLVQEGHSSKTIADMLHISPETVQTHRKNIRRKLGVRGHSAQLSMFLMGNVK